MSKNAGDNSNSNRHRHQSQHHSSGSSSSNGLNAKRFAGKPLKQPPYRFRDIPKASGNLENSIIEEVKDRDALNESMSEIVLLCNEAIRRHRQNQNQNARKKKKKGYSKPLSLEYIADRMDVDDPLWGYYIRTPQHRMLQGFITVTTFTNWQKTFRWDSMHDSAFSYDNDEMALEMASGLRQYDQDGSLAKELQSTVRCGDPWNEGIVWPRIAEISLLGALGCGRTLLSLAIEKLECMNATAQYNYDYVVLQATDNSIPFYESMGFIRVGGITEDYDFSKKQQQKQQQQNDAPQPQSNNTTTNNNTNNDDNDSSSTDPPESEIVSSPVESYTVKKNGETPTQIAKKYKVNVWDILFLNKDVYPNITTTSRLWKGTQLFIPQNETHNTNDSKTKTNATTTTNNQNTTTTDTAADDAPQWYITKNNDTPRMISKMFQVNCKELVEANRERLPELFANSRLMPNTRIKVSHFHIHDDQHVPYCHWTFPDDTLETSEPSYMMARRLNRKKPTTKAKQHQQRPVEHSLAIPITQYVRPSSLSQPSSLSLSLQPSSSLSSTTATTATTDAVVTTTTTTTAATVTAISTSTATTPASKPLPDNNNDDHKNMTPAITTPATTTTTTTTTDTTTTLTTTSTKKKQLLSSKKKPKRKKKKSKKKKRRHPDEPEPPKRPLIGYFLFQNDHRKEAQKVLPNRPSSEIIKYLSTKWRELSDADRKPYQDEQERLKVQYEAEKINYKTKLEAFQQLHPEIYMYKEESSDDDNDDDDDDDDDDDNDEEENEESVTSSKDSTNQSSSSSSSLFNKVVKLDATRYHDTIEYEYYYVLTYIPDLQWCHLAPMKKVGTFGLDRPKAQGRPIWMLVNESEGKELDVSASLCNIVRSRSMRRTVDADTEQWDIPPPSAFLSSSSSSSLKRKTPKPKRKQSVVAVRVNGNKLPETIPLGPTPPSTPVTKISCSSSSSSNSAVKITSPVFNASLAPSKVPKRGRGRPPKTPPPASTSASATTCSSLSVKITTPVFNASLAPSKVPKRGRGRPPKTPPKPPQHEQSPMMLSADMKITSPKFIKELAPSKVPKGRSSSSSSSSSNSNPTTTTTTSITNSSTPTKRGRGRPPKHGGTPTPRKLLHSNETTTTTAVPTSAKKRKKVSVLEVSPPPCTTKTVASTQTNKRARVEVEETSTAPTTTTTSRTSPRKKKPFNPKEGTDSSSSSSAQPVSSPPPPPPPPPPRNNGPFKKGDIVKVESRTWPGVNKPGGVARVLKVHYDQDQQQSNGSNDNGTVVSYDVAYVLGGREKNVDSGFVYQEMELEALSSSPSSRDKSRSNSNSGSTTTPTSPTTVVKRSTRRLSRHSTSTTSSAQDTNQKQKSLTESSLAKKNKRSNVGKQKKSHSSCSDMQQKSFLLNDDADKTKENDGFDDDDDANPSTTNNESAHTRKRKLDEAAQSDCHDESTTGRNDESTGDCVKETITTGTPVRQNNSTSPCRNTSDGGRRTTPIRKASPLFGDKQDQEEDDADIKSKKNHGTSSITTSSSSFDMREKPSSRLAPIFAFGKKANNILAKPASNTAVTSQLQQHDTVETQKVETQKPLQRLAPIFTKNLRKTKTGASSSSTVSKRTDANQNQQENGGISTLNSPCRSSSRNKNGRSSSSSSSRRSSRQTSKNMFGDSSPPAKKGRTETNSRKRLPSSPLLLGARREARVTRAAA